MKKLLMKVWIVIIFFSSLNAQKVYRMDTSCKTLFIQNIIADTSMYAAFIKIRLRDCNGISTVLVSNTALYDYLKKKCKYKFSSYRELVSNAILMDQAITIPDKISNIKVLIPLDANTFADSLYKEKGLEGILDFYVTPNKTMKTDANDFFTGVGILFENKYLVRLNDVEGGLAIKKFVCN